MNIPFNINSRLALSGASAVAASALIIGATFAFFSDTETSVGNAIAAGEIDLKVDNACYYNGQACTQVADGAFHWDGNPDNPECSCSWKLKDLEEGDFFFDLEDVKPGDWEEDTISLHVGSNDAWVCADVKLTSDDDNNCTEPEEADDPNCDPQVDPDQDNADGDLADNLEFIWWADDGDNVLETCNGVDPQAVPNCVEESPLPSGVLGNASVGQTITVDLVDSNNNLWGLTPSPFPGEDTQYIGKGWCFGDITEVPLVQDGVNNVRTPADLAGGGFDCDGASVNNASQTDSVEMDIAFRAVQARNNSPYECTELAPPSPGP